MVKKCGFDLLKGSGFDVSAVDRHLSLVIDTRPDRLRQEGNVSLLHKSASHENSDLNALLVSPRGPCLQHQDHGTTAHGHLYKTESGGSQPIYANVEQEIEASARRVKTRSGGQSTTNLFAARRGHAGRALRTPLFTGGLSEFGG